MKRPRQHIMEEESERLLKLYIPSEWIIRPILKDYGIDLEIEVVDQEVVSGKRIWIQMKSQEICKKLTKKYEITNFPEIVENEILTVECIQFEIDTKELQYAINCPFPLLLFVSDLSEKEVYWIPLRDEIEENLNYLKPNWLSQKTVILHIPIWNSLSVEKKRNFYGLRWYALEPARMYAFASLHYFYHEFQYKGRLSGYKIGDGWIDYGEYNELKSSLELAHRYISSALKLDVLFGENGVDFFISDVRNQLEETLNIIDNIIKLLNKKKFTFEEMSIGIGRVNHAINLFSTTISSYRGLSRKFLLSEGTAFWFKLTNKFDTQIPAIFPLKKNHQ